MSPSPSSNRFSLIVTEEFMRRVEDWRRKQAKIPSVSDAIRTLAELAMASDVPAKGAAKKPKPDDPAG